VTKKRKKATSKKRARKKTTPNEGGERDYPIRGHDDERDDHAAEIAAIIKANQRSWQGYWYWKYKPTGEIGTTCNIFEAAGLKFEGLRSRGKEGPPDCEAYVDGVWAGIEVTELVHRPTLKRSLKAQKERKAGREPERPEAFFAWERTDLLRELQHTISRKDRADLKGGPYDRYILIICTAEFYLNRHNTEQFLQGVTFEASMITDAFLGLDYHPEYGAPVFRLPIVPAAQPRSHLKRG
jgi:hypothetical protein